MIKVTINGRISVILKRLQKTWWVGQNRFRMREADIDNSIVYKPYSLYKDLSMQIKKSIVCSRNASPKVKIIMPFDLWMFNGGMKMAGRPVKKIGRVQYYELDNYQDLIQVSTWIKWSGWLWICYSRNSTIFYQKVGHLLNVFLQLLMVSHQSSNPLWILGIACILVSRRNTVMQKHLEKTKKYCTINLMNILMIVCLYSVHTIYNTIMCTR